MTECMNCSRLGRCRDVDIVKLTNHYRCDRWEEVKPEELQARLDSIQKFGPAAMQAIITLSQEEDS